MIAIKNKEINFRQLLLVLKNNIFFLKLFTYFTLFLLFLFIIGLLKFFQISKDIDSNNINSGSIFHGLPSIDLLKDYKPKELSKIISSDGKVLYEFYDFDSNREVVNLNSIPKHIQNALIANEDKNFFDHYGIHIPSIFRSFYINFASKRRAQGGSTISMQLARNLYDTRFNSSVTHEKTINRKIKEIILAIKIEQVYTKNEIMEMYLNSVYFGNVSSRQMWGIQKASNLIFGKNVTELELHEGSLLVALLPAPNDRVPFRHPLNAKKYRDIVLKNMLTQGYINENQYNQAINKPIPTEPNINKIEFTPYYIQHIEQELKKMHDINYKNGGLIIYTTIDSRIQGILESSFNKIMLDSTQGLQFNFNNTVLQEEEDAYNNKLIEICSCIKDDKIDIFNDSTYLNKNRELHAFDKKNKSKYLKLVKERNIIQDSLTKQCFERVKNILKDENSLIKRNNNNYSIPPELRKQLLVQGASIMFDVKTGSILAMIGGRQENEYYDYFNRSTLATRQPGSIFKPFVYLTAIDEGYSPLTKLKNQSLEIKLPEKSEIWSPENWNDEVGGEYTLRQGLFGSVNLISVRTIYDAQSEGKSPIYGLGINPKKIQNTAYKFNFSTPINAVPSITLGASEVKPIEIISAYSTIANSGSYVEPRIISKITDKNGQIIKKFPPKSEIIELDNNNNKISIESSTYILRDMMTDIVDQYTRSYEDKNNNQSWDKGEHWFPRGTGHTLRTKHNFGFEYTDVNKDGQFNFGWNGENVHTWSQFQKELKSGKVTIPCAGKTGTTNSQTDAWFIGFTPSISMGVWVGMDDKRISLGEKSYGSSAALPIFAKAMTDLYNDLDYYYIDGNKYELNDYDDSWNTIPNGVLELEVCKNNDGGFCTTQNYCGQTKNELFLKNFVPNECE